MHYRASGPVSRLGWMLLGAGVFCVVGAFLHTLLFTNTPSALIYTFFYLLLAVPCGLACAVVAWAGYLVGSSLSDRGGLHASMALVWPAAAALAAGGIAILVTLLSLGEFFAGFLTWSVGAALLGSVLAVTLARLPLDATPRPRSDSA